MTSVPAGFKGISADNNNGRMTIRFRSCLTTSMFLADSEDLGPWAFDQGGKNKAIDDLLWLITQTEDHVCLEVGSELLCTATSSTKARTILTPILSQNQDSLRGLLRDGGNRTVQSAVANAMTKLGLANKDLSSDSDDMTSLINVTLGLLQSKNEEEKTKGKTSQDSLSLERAIEVMAALVTKTQVKNEIVFGSGRCGTGALDKILSACYLVIISYYLTQDF